MTERHCCQRTVPVRDALTTLAPGAILLLLPKCPACLLAYLAVGAGALGIELDMSLLVASRLRSLLIVLSMVVLLYVALRYLRRLAR